MSDLVPSLIRTWVPAAVGALIVFLADFGIDVGSEDATAFFVAVAMGAYYAIVRVIAARWPAAEVLLGHRSTPTYEP